MSPIRLAAAFFAFCLAAVLLVAPPAVHAAGETIGSVKSVQGPAEIIRDNQPIPARPGFKLNVGDILVTGADGRLGIILRDDSLISLGPESRIALENFMFAPAEGALGLTARILRGTMAYLSGLIGRLAPESTRFVTPAATIGVRGTHFAVRVAE
jgi:hypothetical protein